MEEVFVNCAVGMMSLILDVNQVERKARVPIIARAPGREDLLVKWLSEVLFLVEAEGWAFGAFGVEKIDEENVIGWGEGEPLDAERHRIRGEIKAPTYHMLQLKEENGRWEAQVVFDV